MVNQYEVLEVLRKRGYGIGACPGYAFRLTRKTGKVRKTDGIVRGVDCGGIRMHQLMPILRGEADPGPAAARVEAVCLGQPDPGRSSAIPASIDERVEEGVQKALAALGITPEIIEKLRGAPPAPPVEEPVKKRRGRPRKVLPPLPPPPEQIAE